MEISKFYEKLNKIDGNIYVVEEKVELTGGVYDAQLQHDNINTSTLSVFTGPKLTGERIQTYVLSTPSLTPWKRTIRVYADVPTVYISYEAEGDTVEAEDVNQLQEEVVRTQETVNEEISRAVEAEQYIAADLREEVARAKAAEQTVAGNLTAEINRSTGAEQELSWSLTAEINRAKAAEKENADNMVTETARAKTAENTLTENLSAEKTRAMDAEESIRSTIQSYKPSWDDKYTRNEVDNKFATLENAIDWKETVNTYADITEAYPNPQDGWTVNVKDTDYTYRYSGTEWVVISANAIPKATQSVDGLLSKEDKTLYDDANNKKHTHANKTTIDKVTETLLARWNESYDKRHEHGNKGILDTITQALLDNWSAAFVHVSDSVKHITAAERTDWNDANSKKHTHSNKTILDGITSALIANWNAAFTHISDAVKHITANERAAWNTVSNKVDTIPGKGLSTNDYTTGERNKLDGIAAGAEVNVQADWNVTDTASDAYIKNKPTSMPASDVSTWAKAASKPSYAWGEIASKPASFTSAAHTHTKSQITDMSTKMSEFENDLGYITTADIDTSQNHTHANKSVLDTITQTLFNNWNAAYTHISNKSNPHGVTAAQIGAAASNHVHTTLTRAAYSGNSSSGYKNKYCKLASFKISSQYGCVNLKYDCSMYSHGDAMTDYIELGVWVKQQAVFGSNPFVYLSLMRNDKTIKFANFFAVIEELDSTYSKVDLYIQLTTGYCICSLFELSDSRSGVTTVDYFNNGEFIDNLPEGKTAIAETDCSAMHEHGEYLKKSGLTWDDLKGV